MDVLVLGGSHFVGRAIAGEAVRLGHHVTVFNRGMTGTNPSGVTAVTGDRTDHDQLKFLASRGPWGAVFDTWSGAPVHATRASQLLSPSAQHYVYISSRSVYADPLALGADETHPCVHADPLDDGSGGYAENKRGAELGVLGARPDALITRAGLILGPHEDVGRLPWWLNRLAAGGRVIAPGPRERPLQYIDARDLASWVIRCAQRQVGGVFNTVSPTGHTTMGALLDTARQVCRSTAELVWFTPEEVEQAGIQPWSELPIWLPPAHESAGLHDADVTAAQAAGLRCRPMEETVADTWAWMVAEGFRPSEHIRGAIGLDPAREQAVLAQREAD